MHPRPSPVRDRVFRYAVPILALVLAVSAHAAPTPGFIETWSTAGDLRGWAGGLGQITFENPGTGGADGAGDGYLRLSSTGMVRFGTVSFGPEYAGNWLMSGVRSLRVKLNDVNTDEPLEIHFGLGTIENFWQYNEGFQPPLNAWAEFVVDLDDSTKFTRTRGTESFAMALQTADRIHLRHDLAPFVTEPDQIQADLGIDSVTLSGVSVDVIPTTWGRIKRLYR